MADHKWQINKIFVSALAIGLFAISYLLFTRFTLAATSNIDVIERWAWNDVIGWIDFRYAANPNVEVFSNEVRGYGDSAAIGFISLHCQYGPPGSNCTVPYNVVNTNGVLSGWGWSDQIGWVSFNCNNVGIGNTCAASNYSVTISSGQFSGWAWNDVIGWISFNAANCDINNNGFWDVSCGGDDTTTTVIDFAVETTWGSGPQSGDLTSSIFDTQDTDGVALNTIMWQGTLNNGDVKFQVASSNSSSGPWSFVGPLGAGTYYGSGAGPNIQTKLDLSDHNNKRYFRYRVFIDSDTGGENSPQVDDVIISYSP